MSPLLLNTVFFLLALAVLFGVWISVHLLARHRIGDRKLGCRGPSVDAQGNSICCNSGAACEETAGHSKKVVAAGKGATDH